MEGKFNEWRKVQRRSAQIRAAIFYPTKKRNYDFMLCINRYTPLAQTRIQDAEIRASKTRLGSVCKSIGLQFGYTTGKPILLPQEPDNCTLDAINGFVRKLEAFKKQVGCSIRELGEIPRFG